MSLAKQCWQNDEDYKYLNGKTSKEWARGWAWEFLRRSSEYRENYMRFADLQNKHGSDWQKKQPKDQYYPPLKDGESESDWRRRSLDQHFVAEKITRSQLVARRWYLVDLYDPKQIYDPSIVRFRFEGCVSPLIYAYSTHDKDLSVENMDRLAYDLKHVHGKNVLVAVFDLDLPMKSQTARYEKIHLVRSVHKRGENKLPHLTWKKLVRMIDAIEANPDMKEYEIGAIVGLTNDKNALYGATNDLKKDALEMRDGGYWRILKKLSHDIAAGENPNKKKKSAAKDSQ